MLCTQNVSLVDLLQLEELLHGSPAVLRHPLLQRGEGVPPHTGLGVRVEVVQEVDGLAVRVTTDDDVLHAVVDAGQLEHGGVCGHTLDRDLGAGGKIFLRPGKGGPTYL